jgi:hypothetical protein
MIVLTRVVVVMLALSIMLVEVSSAPLPAQNVGPSPTQTFVPTEPAPPWQVTPSTTRTPTITPVGTPTPIPSSTPSSHDPYLNLTKREGAPGSFITFGGFSFTDSPQASIFLNDVFIGAVPNSQGWFQFQLDTRYLEEGYYTLRVDTGVEQRAQTFLLDSDEPSHPSDTRLTTFVAPYGVMPRFPFFLPVLLK